MKERPILFSGSMVRAILDGRKRVTRRIVKHPEGDLVDPREDAVWRVASDGLWHPCIDMLARGALDPIAPGLRCPYGQPGDRLWVKETWRFLGTDMMRHGRTHTVQDGVFEYRADNRRATIERPWQDIEQYMATRHGKNWRPSISMRQWVSRLTLSVESVRVERLNDISEEDAKAEGCAGGNDSIPGYRFSATPVEHFRHLWDEINGDRAGWASNPFVWVIGFRVAEVRR